MTEIERLKAELAAVEREDADAKAAAEAIKAGEKPGKIRRAPKPKVTKAKKRTRQTVHRSGLVTSIEGYGGPAPVGTSRQRTSNRPVVTRHLDPTDRPVDDEYERHECLLLAAAEAGSNLNGINCRCVDCSYR